MKKLVAVCMVTAFAHIGAVPAFAQDQSGRGQPDTSKKNPYAGSPLTWSVEPIIDNYVSQMTRYYNLTKDQEEYTRQLLTQRVKRFLNDYESDVRALFTEYWYLQFKGEMPTPEQAKDLARRGGPLIAAMKKEILDGNQKWREILDEKQQKIHDRDLEQMTKVFDDLDDKINRWSKGDVQQKDFGPSRQPDIGGPPPKPMPPEDAWEFKVRSFIAEYSLDAGQRETAQSILRELKGEATRYRERNKEKLTALNARLQEIYKSGPITDPDDRKQAAEKVKKLNEEINTIERPIREDLWRQLLARLDRIPTDEQRRLRKEKLDRLTARGMAGRRTETRPADTQPESTRPAATTSPAAAASAQ
jgi:hypothetical protein